jgi:hypothetical protein
MRSVVRALLIITVLAGCGDDDHGDSAKEKCETLVDTFCETVTSCAEDADLLADDYSPRELLADCKETVGEGAHCSDAKKVTSKYSACLAAAGEKLACEDSNQSLLDDDTFAIPAVCEGVVGY